MNAERVSSQFRATHAVRIDGVFCSTGAHDSPRSRLAYNVVTSAGFDIAVVAADGTESRSVVAEPASEERPRWSPDGRWLTYYSDAAGSWDVYVVDVETGSRKALTDAPGFDGQPAWQPVPAQ